MSVKAKFYVTSIQEHSTGPGGSASQKSVRLAPVYGKDGSENAEWSKYTPSGQIEMTITNEAALAQFGIGKEFYVTFDAAHGDVK